MARLLDPPPAVDARSQLVAEVLESAARRVERGWTTGHQARTLEGAPVPPEHPQASRWCAFGALRAEGLARLPGDRPGGLRLAELAARYVALVLAHLGQPVVARHASRTLMEWNDRPGRNEREVVAVYRRTVRALQRQSRRPVEAGRGAASAVQPGGELALPR